MSVVVHCTENGDENGEAEPGLLCGVLSDRAGALVLCIAAGSGLLLTLKLFPIRPSLLL